MIKVRGRKRLWLIGGAAALVVFGVLGAGAMRPSKPVDPSKLATIEKGDIAKSVVATGKIEPLAKVQVKSKASGIVKKLLADYGEVVHVMDTVRGAGAKTLGIMTK